jgi:hypothetical protein
LAKFDVNAEQLERRSAIGRWQYVTVTFTAANVDHVIEHQLPTPSPEQIYYEVVRVSAPCTIYHDGSATRRKWGTDFLFLRCDFATVTADIRLIVSAEPLDARPLPAGTFVSGVDAGTLGGNSPNFYRDADNINAGTLSLLSGGTNAALVDPGADRIFFWDDSGSTTDWLEVGAGLQISGTTLSVTGAGAGGTLSFTATTHTIADDGAGTAPASTLSPTSSYVKITNNDADGATVTLSEAGISDGQHLLLVNVGANPVTFPDSAGVQELAGAAVLAQYDTLSLLYVSDRWVELARSNN